MLLAVAMMLSYIEAILPLSLILPLPGIKLGLANIAVMTAFFCISPIDGVFVSLSRTLLSSLLFGTAASFVFSLFGAVLSLFGMWLSKKFFSKVLSFYGMSVLCAALHSIGQIAAAMLVIKGITVLSYLPVMLVASVICGFLTGAILFPVSKLKIFGGLNA